jgi:hypothetical protein
VCALGMRGWGWRRFAEESIWTDSVRSPTRTLYRENCLTFRFQVGFVDAMEALLLAVAFGLTMCWPMAFTAKSPESVNLWGVHDHPVAHVRELGVRATGDDPGVAQGLSERESDLARGRSGEGPDARRAFDEPLVVAVWLAGISAVFASLTVAGSKTVVVPPRQTRLLGVQVGTSPI